MPSDTVAKTIYLELIARITRKEVLPHEFVEMMMEMYDSWEPAPDRSVHGRFFEYVVGESLAQNGVTSLYYQAKVLHVPLATFDWLLYHETRPVSISCKTSPRGSW